MSKLESDESVQNSEPEHKLTMAEPAARFLWRALQELRLADNTITVKEVMPFAAELMRDMDLMIGDEETLRDVFCHIDQWEFYHRNGQRETATHLSEKILQSQINLVKIDREFPF